MCMFMNLLPSGSEQHEVLLFGSIQEGLRQARHLTVQIERKKTLKYWHSWVVKIRAVVSMLAKGCIVA